MVTGDRMMQLRLIRSKPALVMITLLAAGVLCWGQKQTIPPPPTTRSILDPQLEKILTRLENRQVHDLRAEVSWKLMYLIDLDEDAIVKQGRLWYQQQKPVAKFLVHFDRKITSNRAHKLDERHMFDGRWYVELKSDTKTVIRREIRHAGDLENPYKLGEGPFPLPFGQKKADILKEFEVTLIPSAQSDPPDSDHLKLIPHEGSQTGRNYKHVEVWIAREGPQRGLPIKVKTAKKAPTGRLDSFITITFKNVRLNEGFSGGIFDIKTPPGYHEEIETLEPIQVPKGTEP
jgi:hypothetical protein